MDAEPPLVPADTPVGELAGRIARGEAALTKHQALLLVDAQGLLAGIVTRGDLVRSLERDPKGELTALEAGSAELQVAFPDELLGNALTRMLHCGCGRLPVVARDDQRKIIGYLGRAAMLEARLQRLHDEHVSEPGWLKTSLRNNPR
jgi:CBS domain-containing protein